MTRWPRYLGPGWLIAYAVSSCLWMAIFEVTPLPLFLVLVTGGTAAVIAVGDWVQGVAVPAGEAMRERPIGVPVTARRSASRRGHRTTARVGSETDHENYCDSDDVHNVRLHGGWTRDGEHVAADRLRDVRP